MCVTIYCLLILPGKPIDCIEIQIT